MLQKTTKKQQNIMVHIWLIESFVATQVHNLLYKKDKKLIIYYLKTHNGYLYIMTVLQQN